MNRVGCNCTLCLQRDPPPALKPGDSYHFFAMSGLQVRGLVAVIEAAQGLAGYTAPDEHQLPHSLEQLRALLPVSR